jgi:hypothetical protein
MHSASIVVFILAAGTLIAVGALLVWRRRLLAAVTHNARPRLDEHTLFATTYEQLGVARPEPAPKTDDATAWLAYDELGLEPTSNPEATALLSMDEMLAAPEPVNPARPVVDDHHYR